jgi:hypothetical protein
MIEHAAQATAAIAASDARPARFVRVRTDKT